MLNIHERFVSLKLETLCEVYIFFSVFNVVSSPCILSFPVCLYRYQCGMPVMIKGETGVGKTALLEMLSKLWNYSILLEWKRQRSRLLDFVRRKLGNIPADVSNSYQVCY